ncbi:hypothetical protein SAMN05519104_0955 [Rhizobiales bacterium GAS188]|nr:hypothetical protein SAMN05519104_0955 [Rhizobiales bacterium GAS188]
MPRDTVLQICDREAARRLNPNRRPTLTLTRTLQTAMSRATGWTQILGAFLEIGTHVGRLSETRLSANPLPSRDLCETPTPVIPDAAQHDSDALQIRISRLTADDGSRVCAASLSCCSAHGMTPDSANARRRPRRSQERPRRSRSRGVYPNAVNAAAKLCAARCLPGASQGANTGLRRRRRRRICPADRRRSRQALLQWRSFRPTAPSG